MCERTRILFGRVHVTPGPAPVVVNDRGEMSKVGVTGLLCSHPNPVFRSGGASLLRIASHHRQYISRTTAYETLTYSSPNANLRGRLFGSHPNRVNIARFGLVTAIRTRTMSVQGSLMRHGSWYHDKYDRNVLGRKMGGHLVQLRYYNTSGVTIFKRYMRRKNNSNNSCSRNGRGPTCVRLSA